MSRNRLLLLSPGIKFSEDAGATWHDMSPWVEFFIRQGMQWPDYSAAVGARRIRLISMPCQSHGAGLAALGAVMRDLGDAAANDRSRHIDGLMKYADQYLRACKDCDLTACNPVFKRCGFREKASGVVLKAKTTTKFRVHPDSSLQTGDLKLLQVMRNGKDVPVGISDRNYYYDCYPEGGVALQEGLSGARIESAAYANISPVLSVSEENAATAYSGLCYAGSPQFGATSTKQFNYSFMLDAGRQLALAELLPIRGWGSPKVPRLVFVNTRSEVSFSHLPVSPRLVIVDGTGAFLRCIDHPALARADVLAVVRRDGRRDRDEMLSDKLKSLLQWYERRLVDVGAPQGVSVFDFIPIT